MRASAHTRFGSEIVAALLVLGSALDRLEALLASAFGTAPVAAHGLKQRLDLVAVMVTVIIAGVTGYVGINIMQNTVDTTGLTSGDTFFAAQGNLTDGLESFFSNLGTVFVVIVLVVIIGYLMLLRGR